MIYAARLAFLVAASWFLLVAFIWLLRFLLAIA